MGVNALLPLPLPAFDAFPLLPLPLAIGVVCTPPAMGVDALLPLPLPVLDALLLLCTPSTMGVVCT
ncbi:hypothetical protein GIB67_007920 [Kingdonia uniflora]|uniref:Uncharacterized protein n=1 Tax=Kingdonia uniflora TaxID=39325 RepID=A0A7J7PAT7_9MAGN|nr:hypothetical protein GIB67_007920 [Kingdonia uniflora]